MAWVFIIMCGVFSLVAGIVFEGGAHAVGLMFWVWSALCAYAGASLLGDRRGRK